MCSSIELRLSQAPKVCDAWAVARQTDSSDRRLAEVVHAKWNSKPGRIAEEELAGLGSVGAPACHCEESKVSGLRAVDSSAFP